MTELIEIVQGGKDGGTSLPGGQETHYPVGTKVSLHPTADYRHITQLRRNQFVRYVPINSSGHRLRTYLPGACPLRARSAHHQARLLLA
ncbi:hypothetical protein [Nitrospira sp. CMX1]|nr:hypothetical protein [Nitrospira sp.]